MDRRLTELAEQISNELDESGSAPDATLERLLTGLSAGPVPVGRLGRFRALGSLQARIAVGYLAHWIRGGYGDAEARQASLNETRLKAALRLLESMGYLRGAIMKVGQLLAHYPNVVPVEFASLLGRLHFEAPPMHFALLGEFVRGELGADPGRLFDDFETQAFAAASLGQVHRARLKGSQKKVAIKIQYPNIGRTISDDFRNLKALMSPMRLSPDWDNLVAQMDEIRHMVEMETDYLQEAHSLRVARTAFGDEDGIVVPEVYPELSTRRVLAMEHIDGIHLKAFLATGPSQDSRDSYGFRITQAVYRLCYQKRILYADPHPGNYFFMPDGRLGLVDFGCCRQFSDEDVDYSNEMERSVFTSPAAVRQALARAVDVSDDRQIEPDHMQLLERYIDWLWEPVFEEGPFDFGNADYFRRGLEIYGELIRRRYIRSLPINTWFGKLFIGLRAMLTQLGARVDVGAILRQERERRETD